MLGGTTIALFLLPKAPEEYFMKQFNENLRRLIRLTKEMSTLADEGDRNRTDCSCGIIYGILRDSAHKLKKVAQAECQSHREQNIWDENN
jgi:hypothetical protein